MSGVEYSPLHASTKEKLDQRERSTGLLRSGRDVKSQDKSLPPELERWVSARRKSTTFWNINICGAGKTDLKLAGCWRLPVDGSEGQNPQEGPGIGSPPWPGSPSEYQRKVPCAASRGRGVGERHYFEKSEIILFFLTGSAITGKLVNQRLIDQGEGNTQLQPPIAILSHLRGWRRWTEKALWCSQSRVTAWPIDWDLITRLWNTSPPSHLATTLLKAFSQQFLWPGTPCEAMRKQITRHPQKARSSVWRDRAGIGSRFGDGQGRWNDPTRSSKHLWWRCQMM